MAEVELVGKEYGKLDDKNRLAIPARFRKEFGPGEVYVTAAKERGCLNIYPNSTFAATKEEVKRQPRTTPEGLDAWARLSHFTEKIPVDAQGRIVVPRDHLTALGITAPADIVCAGMFEWIEVWERSRYEAKQSGGG